MKKTRSIRKMGFLPRLLLLINASLLICLFMSSWIAMAAGLGKLTIGSYLGQPFKAEIELIAVKDGDIPALTAKLASPEAFRQAGLKYLDYHAGLSVTVARRVDGRPYLQILSSQGVNEPFINLLIELNSPAGRLLREYTVLLDPAEMPLMPQTPVVQDNAVKTASSKSEQTTARVTESVKPAASGVQQSSTDDWTETSYGPVAPGDNLTRIARQITPNGVDLNQMLVALYRANRAAFIEKNMNLLRVGAILRIPEQREIASISPKEAVREVRTQTADWHSYRQRVANMASGATNSQSQQATSGKITTVADDTILAEGTVSQEVLRLSKGELLQDKHLVKPGAGESSAQQTKQMMEEDAIAKEHTRQEASERAAHLEQNVNRLQRLLQLKEEGLTPEQSPEPMPGDPSVTSPAETASVSALGAASQALAENSIMPEFTIPAQPVTDPNLAPILQPDMIEPDEFAWINTLIDFAVENIMLVGGALTALLATWLGISMFRRRQEQAEMDAYDDMANYEVIGPENSSAAVATVYTEETLEQPSSYREAEKHETEEPVASSAFFFGKKLDEHHPLMDDASPAASSQTELEDSAELSRMFRDEIKIEADDDSRTGFKQTADIAAEETIDKWRFPSSETREVKNQPEENIFSEEVLIEKPLTSQDSHEIDFESSGYADIMKQSEHKPAKLGEQFAHIDLNLGEESTITPVFGNVMEAEEDRWQEVSTKIDLAKAYLEMEDKDGAREILQEVLQEGDSEQQAAARTILSEISN